MKSTTHLEIAKKSSMNISTAPNADALRSTSGTNLEPNSPPRCEECDALASSNCQKHTFDWSSLSAELRVLIYEACLRRDTPVFLGSPTLNFRDRAHAIRAHADPLAPEILRLSKAIHKEAMPVLYSKNTITLGQGGSADLSHRQLHEFPQRIRSLIRSLTVTFGTASDSDSSSEPGTKQHTQHDFETLLSRDVRYCFRLKELIIVLEPACNVDCLSCVRWVPQGCKVILAGAPPPMSSMPSMPFSLSRLSLGSPYRQTMTDMVQEQNELAKELDRVSDDSQPVCSYLTRFPTNWGNAWR